MAQPVRIRHSGTGMVRTGLYGFSWTYLFFGWFVPVFRGELAVGALHLVFTFITFGLWQFIFCFLYNKQYMTRMLLNGWELADTQEVNDKARTALNITSPSP